MSAMTPAPDTSPEAVERMIDNAATASQHLPLIDDAVVREAIKLNIVGPLTQHIDRLSGELATKEQERLRAETLNGDMVIRIAAVERVLAATEAEVAALKERLEASERDAARYRWLRERIDYGYTHPEAALVEIGQVASDDPEELDQRIDAALARGGPFERIADGPNTEPNGGQG